MAMEISRVLLVDDSKTTLRFLSEVLVAAGYAVETASTGKYAVQTVLKGPPYDLILLDLKLPDMDGLSVLNQIRRATTQPAVVMLTGHSTIKTATEAVQQGADGFISKHHLTSTDRDEFLGTLQQALQHRQKELSLQRMQRMLEIGIEERTLQLSNAIALLRAEVNARARAQRELEKLNEDLERRVVYRTSELLEMNREMELFMATVSHDLGSPLRVMGGYASFLLDDFGHDLEPKAREYVESIQRNAMRGARLVQDLLTFSRAGRTEFQPRQVDMEAMVREVLAELPLLYPDHAPRVTLAALPGAWGDAQQLRRVWSNLIGNAYKFTQKQDDPRLEIGVLPCREGTRYFVQDNGLGFDSDDACSLFRSFTRRTSDSLFEGSGLGLATVKRIVERHGGTVGAKGAPGEGALFWFELPLPDDDEAVPAAAPEPE